MKSFPSIRITLLVFFLSAPLVSLNAQEPPPTPVIVAEVVQQSLQDEIELVGTAEPRRRSRVASETEGLVIGRFCEVGQSVSRGEAIFRLENDVLSAGLIEALADVKLRQFNHTRSIELLRQDAVSEQILHDDAYQLERARAKLQGLEKQVEDLTIRAPYAGHVVEISTEIGEWVRRGDQVVQVIAIDTVWVRVLVPERHVARLRVGNTAQVVVDALGSAPRPGRIVAILAQGAVDSRTFPVLVELTNPGGRIRSGMAARVNLGMQSATPPLLVSKDALVNTPGGMVVYLAVDDKAVSRPVKPGLAYSGYVAVDGDLQPGDLAIVRGNERLRDGQSVRIIRKQQ